LRAIDHVPFYGGNLALDFVDTIGGTLEDPTPDYMATYADLVTFGQMMGAVSERQARSLRRAARERPADAEAAYATAVERRAQLDAAFRPLSVGEQPPVEALEALREFGAQALAHAELVPDGHGGFEWSWAHCDELDAPLWPIAHSALELITEGPLDRVKTCGRCRWLFLDTTKNHSRRWCSTEGCGTDAKKERYVARRRELRGAGSSSSG
jgi:predicted RNA-binding Zn ribbon-like protein